MGFWMLQVASPTCIWALSLDGRVFGVLLLLESWDASNTEVQTPEMWRSFDWNTLRGIGLDWEQKFWPFGPGKVDGKPQSCLILRKFQQTPGTDPRYPKIQIWKDFLHKQVVEDLGYVPGVCWSFLRLIHLLIARHLTSFFQPVPKSRASGYNHKMRHRS